MPEMVAPRSGLPDPRTSRAVLVGVSEYTTLDQLPAVANNIATLRQVLTDADLWGLPAEHCATLLNPSSIDEVLDAVHAEALAASDALLFYFAGHGLLDERSDLYLALPSADSDRLHRAVRYDDIRREFIGAARACYGKVVILDCCYSGRALLAGMSGSAEMADHARVDGAYLMTATGETSVALAPPGENYTAFTGALVDKLVHGLPDGPDLLDMETLFHHVRADLKARLYPVPHAYARNDGKAIALVRNRQHSGDHTPVELAEVVVRVLPQPPVGLEPLLRHRPADLYAEVWAMRENGQHRFAEQVLAASAALRADQEVAAIIDLLRRQGLATDVQTVLTAAAQRSPEEVLRIVDILHDTDQPGDATELVRVAGAGQVDDVANLAHLLEDSARTKELIELLDAALDIAHARSSLIDLVNALWVAGLRHEVDRMIGRAASKLPEAVVVDLADELRAVGREEAAFGIYARAAETVATRPPEAVAQLCHAMTEAGHERDSDRVARAMIDRARDGESQLDVAIAFWNTDQQRHADETLTRAGEVLSNADVTTLAAELRDRGREQSAYLLCLRAMVARPATAIQEIITALRGEGRPVDARKLLEDVSGEAPVQTVLELLDICEEGDRQRVLRKATERDPYDVAKLLNALIPTHPAIAQQLEDRITATRGQLRPFIVEQLAPSSKEWILARIVRAGDAREVAALLRALPAGEARLLLFLAVQTGNPTLLSIIKEIPPDSHLLDQPVTRLAPLLDGLRTAGLEQHTDATLGAWAAPDRGVHAVARDIAFLFGEGKADAGRLLLNRALHDLSNTLLPYLIDSLRRQNQPEALAAAADWVRETYAHRKPSNVDRVLREIGLSEYASRSPWLKRRRKNG